MNCFYFHVRVVKNSQKHDLFKFFKFMTGFLSLQKFEKRLAVPMKDNENSTCRENNFKIQGVNNHFGGSLKLTSCGLNITMYLTQKTHKI